MQTPGLAEHLRPLVARHDLDARALEIDPAALATRLGRRLLLVALLGQIVERVDRAQPVLRAVEERASVLAEADLADLVRDRCAALLLEIVGEERSALFGLLVVARDRLHAADRKAREEDASAGCDDLCVVAFLYRKPEHASGDAVEVDRDVVLLLALSVTLVRPVIVVAVDRMRFRNER